MGFVLVNTNCVIASHFKLGCLFFKLKNVNPGQLDKSKHRCQDSCLIKVCDHADATQELHYRNFSREAGAVTEPATVQHVMGISPHS